MSIRQAQTHFCLQTLRKDSVCDTLWGCGEQRLVFLRPLNPRDNVAVRNFRNYHLFSPPSVTMQFASLASGSKGNAWLVAHDSSLTLIDCGINYTTLCQRMNLLNLTPADLSALCLTHEHSDHVAGVTSLRKKHPNLPVFCSHGTAYAINLSNHRAIRDAQIEKVADDLYIEAFTVPHDAHEPLQFRLMTHTGKQALRIAIVTDLGHASKHLIHHLEDCRGLALEFNHDPDLLKSSAYHPALKKRIGGDFGHLSNSQSLDILRGLTHSPCSVLMAAHLSEKTNTSDLVREHLLSLMSETQYHWRTHICEQYTASPWYKID